MIGFRGKFAVEAEKTLFIRGKGADVDLVLLVGVHLGGGLNGVVLLCVGGSGIAV